MGELHCTVPTNGTRVFLRDSILRLVLAHCLFAYIWVDRRVNSNSTFSLLKYAKKEAVNNRHKIMGLMMGLVSESM